MTEGQTKGATVGDEERPDRIETGSEDDNRPEDGTISDEKTCPECGAPVENLRKTCPQCGYEYQEDDYSDREAGDEFVAGSQVDEEGNELPSDDASDDDSDDASEDSSSDDD